MNNRGYIKVTETVPADGITPVSDGIQKIIDENPNRTIFFPDGVYLLDKPIQTPADPKRSVCLELSGYAVLRAADGWAHDEAMVRLGATYPANDTVTVGSNYSFKGGVIDGNGVADGISIDGGRETLVYDLPIEYVKETYVITMNFSMPDGGNYFLFFPSGGLV